jgi:putative SOS response-associated peptidase YedK
MPVIVAASHYDWWLKMGDPRREMHKSTIAFPENSPLKIYLVSNLVNSPNSDDPRCTLSGFG